MERLYNLFTQYPTVCTDSRHVLPDSIFFALRGGNFNANAFARSALEQGCRYAVVDEAQYATDDRFILVDDVLRTLQQLAAHHRRTLGTTIIGITGTNGKTTTKELVAAVLREKYRILYTQGNLNNHIGVPLTLLRLRPEHQLAVVEMGASHPGEIAELCEIARPDYGLITNVGKGHLEGFGSFEGVKQTKAALYAFVAHHGRGAFVNTDNPHLMEMAKALQPDLRVQPYVPGTVTECSPFLHMELQASCALCGAFPVHTRLIGAYNAENVRAAATVGCFFDLTDTQIRHALEHYEPQNAARPNGAQHPDCRCLQRQPREHGSRHPQLRPNGSPAQDVDIRRNGRAGRAKRRRTPPHHAAHTRKRLRPRSIGRRTIPTHRPTLPLLPRRGRAARIPAPAPARWLLHPHQRLAHQPPGNRGGRFVDIGTHEATIA